MEMADRIKERRIAMNFTQEELAQKLGLQKSAIAKYEKGRVENIKRSIIEKMSELLDCSPAYLMGFDVPMERDNYWENEKRLEMDFHSFIHDYLGYESPYTLDGKVDLILKKEPNTIYRVSAEEYDNFYEITKERIEQEFSFLLRRAEKLSKKSKESLIPFPQEEKTYLEPVAAHERTDVEVTDEMRKHDNDIMDNDEFWK